MLPPNAPPAAVAALRNAIEVLNHDPAYAEEAMQTLGFAPEWIAGPDTNAQVRRSLSITPAMRAFIASYVKGAKKKDLTVSR